MIYKIAFTGRPIGAIGIDWRHYVEVWAESEDSAVSNLHNHFDHISRVNINGKDWSYSNYNFKPEHFEEKFEIIKKSA